MSAPSSDPGVPRPGGSNLGTAPGVESGVSRFVIALAVVGTILLALGAFWLSFTALRDLVVLAGLPEDQAWIWPLIVDGVILEATISVVALRNSAPAARRFAWLLLGAGSGVSVAANITHAVLAADDRIPALIAALVASVPPLVLLAMTHLTVELTRNRVLEDAPPESSTDAVLETASMHAVSQPARAAIPEVVTAPRALVLQPRLKREISPGTSAEGWGDARARASAMSAEGVSKRQIATDLGVHPTTVGRWLNAPDRRQDGDSHD